MSRQRIKIEVGERNFIIRGWRVRDLCRDAGIRVVYAGTVNGWIGDTQRLSDLLAHLDHRNVRHDLVEFPERSGGAA